MNTLDSMGKEAKVKRLFTGLKQGGYSPVQRCLLHQHSVSVHRAITSQRSLSSQFIALMESTVRSVVESSSTILNYTCTSVDYMSYQEIHNFSRLYMFSFSLGIDSKRVSSKGLMIFGSSLPGRFLGLCFGSETSPTPQLSPRGDHPAGLSKAGLYLVQKLAKALAKAWCQAWGAVLGGHEPSSQWLGNSCDLLDLQQDYLCSRFTVEFKRVSADEPEPGDCSLPLEFVTIAMPVNTLGNALLQQTGVFSAQESSSRILSKLLQTPISITAVLACKSVSLAFVDALKPGGVIPINKPGNAQLKVGTKTLFQATAGQCSDQFVLEVTDPALS